MHCKLIHSHQSVTPNLRSSIKMHCNFPVTCWTHFIHPCHIAKNCFSQKIQVFTVTLMVTLSIFKITQVFSIKNLQLPQINKIWLLNFIPSVPHIKPNLWHLGFQALLVVLTSHTSLKNVPIRNQNYVNDRKHTIF